MFGLIVLQNPQASPQVILIYEGGVHFCGGRFSGRVWVPVSYITWGGRHVKGADFRTHPLSYGWIASGGAGLRSLTSAPLTAGVGESCSKRERPEGPPMLFKRSSSRYLGEPGQRGLRSANWRNWVEFALPPGKDVYQLPVETDEVIRMNADRWLQAPEAGSADVVVKWLLVLATCFWTGSSVISQPKLL